MSLTDREMIVAYYCLRYSYSYSEFVTKRANPPTFLVAWQHIKAHLDEAPAWVLDTVRRLEVR